MEGMTKQPSPALINIATASDWWVVWGGSQEVPIARTRLIGWGIDESGDLRALIPKEGSTTPVVTRHH